MYAQRPYFAWTALTCKPRASETHQVNNSTEVHQEPTKVSSLSWFLLAQEMGTLCYHYSHVMFENLNQILADRHDHTSASQWFQHNSSNRIMYEVSVFSAREKALQDCECSLTIGRKIKTRKKALKSKLLDNVFYSIWLYSISWMQGYEKKKEKEHKVPYWTRD